MSIQPRESDGACNQLFHDMSLLLPGIWTIVYFGDAILELRTLSSHESVGHFDKTKGKRNIQLRYQVEKASTREKYH